MAPLMLFALSGCGGREGGTSDNVISITVHERSIDGTINLADIVDSVTYIPLETTNESLLDRIVEVFFVDDTVLVRVNSRVFLFDKNGKYLRKISRQGRGPGEYLDLSQMMFDEVGRRIIILDGYADRLLYYDMEGRFVKDVPEFATGYIPRDIVNLSDGNFLCYRPDHDEVPGATPGGIWEVDSTGAFKRWVRKDDMIHPVTFAGDMNYFYPLPDGRIGFQGVETESCYYYDGNDMVEYCRYVFDGNTVRDFKGVDNVEWMSRFPQKDMFLIRDYIFDTGRYLFSGWLDDRHKQLYTLYDKSTGSLKTTRMPADNESPKILTHRSGSWVGWEFVPSNDPNVIVISAPHNLIYGTDTETDNPVLQVLHVKRPE
jgi:hypothetical protein